MSELKQCPFCDGFISVSTGRVPSGGWAARNKCMVCGAELTCFGETEDDAIIALLKAWNTRAELPAAYASISPSIDMLREHGVVVEHTCHNADQSNP